MKKIVPAFIICLFVLGVAGIAKLAYDHYLDDKINHAIIKELQSLSATLNIHIIAGEPITIDQAFEQKTYRYITKEKVIYFPPSPHIPITNKFQYKAEKLLEVEGKGVLITVYSDGHSSMSDRRTSQWKQRD